MGRRGEHAQGDGRIAAAALPLLPMSMSMPMPMARTLCAPLLGHSVGPSYICRAIFRPTYTSDSGLGNSAGRFNATVTPSCYICMHIQCIAVHLARAPIAAIKHFSLSSPLAAAPLLPPLAATAAPLAASTLPSPPAASPLPPPLAHPLLLLLFLHPSHTLCCLSPSSTPCPRPAASITLTYHV